MSGQLKILRHKSWNVYNQKNVEKVLRDERLHNESINDRNRQEKVANSEIILQQTLQHGCDDGSISNDSSNKKEQVPFRLFDDIEESIRLKQENHEYANEREDKRLRDLKKAGMAPWKLTEGADIIPWYISGNHNSSSSSSSSSSSAYVIDKKRARDERWKDLADPMHHIYKNSFKTDGRHGNSSKKSKHTSSSLSSSRGDVSIHALREKRLAREYVEKKRTQQLLWNKS